MSGDPVTSTSNSTASNNATDPNELLKLVRDFQVSELTYWRDHRWNIFSWAAGLLLGGTGAVFVFGQTITGANTQHLLPQKVFLALAVIVFVGIASWWMHRARDHELHARTIIAAIDSQLGLYRGVLLDYQAPPPSHALHTGTIWALVALGVFAILAIFVAA